MTDKDKLISEYIKLAKRANKRLYNLEKLSKESGFENVTKWGYRNALYDIQQRGGDRRYKLKIDKNINTKTLSAMRNEVYKFLNYPTSTKRGIVTLYKEKTEKFNKDYGTNWKWQDMANYFESGGKELFEEKFSSSTSLKVLGVFQKNKKDIKKIKEKIDEFNNDNKKTDKLLDTFIKNMKGNTDKEGNKIIDWKLKESIKDLLLDKELKIEEFL